MSSSQSRSLKRKREEEEEVPEPGPIHAWETRPLGVPTAHPPVPLYIVKKRFKELEQRYSRPADSDQDVVQLPNNADWLYLFCLDNPALIRNALATRPTQGMPWLLRMAILHGSGNEGIHVVINHPDFMPDEDLWNSLRTRWLFPDTYFCVNDAKRLDYALAELRKKWPEPDPPWPFHISRERLLKLFEKR